MQKHVGKNATPQKNQTRYRNQDKYANIWQINEVYDKDEQDGRVGVWKMSANNKHDERVRVKLAT